MKVSELIKLLQKYDGNLTVVYQMHSEFNTLKKDDIDTAMLQPARPDGWVHDSWGKKELCTVKYLVFPGN